MQPFSTCSALIDLLSASECVVYGQWEIMSLRISALRVWLFALMVRIAILTNGAPFVAFQLACRLRIISGNIDAMSIYYTVYLQRVVLDCR